MNNNLIQNPQWRPGPGGGPQFFSGNGSTYDNFYIDGYRTCSITRSPETLGETSDKYDPPIPVLNGRYICWGYTLRAIEAEAVTLVAMFYDRAGNYVDTVEQPIESQITASFQSIMRRFRIPSGAYTVQLSLIFNGTVTACTYYAPTAYFC